MGRMQRYTQLSPTAKAPRPAAAPTSKITPLVKSIGGAPAAAEDPIAGVPARPAFGGRRTFTPATVAGSMSNLPSVQEDKARRVKAATIRIGSENRKGSRGGSGMAPMRGMKGIPKK